MTQRAFLFKFYIVLSLINAKFTGNDNEGIAVYRVATEVKKKKLPDFSLSIFLDFHDFHH